MKKENINARFFRSNPMAGAYRIVEGQLIPAGTSSRISWQYQGIEFIDARTPEKRIEQAVRTVIERP